MGILCVIKAQELVSFVFVNMLAVGEKKTKNERQRVGASGLRTIVKRHGNQTAAGARIIQRAKGKLRHDIMQPIEAKNWIAAGVGLVKIVKRKQNEDGNGERKIKKRRGPSNIGVELKREWPYQNHMISKLSVSTTITVA